MEEYTVGYRDRNGVLRAYFFCYSHQAACEVVGHFNAHGSHMKEYRQEGSKYFVVCRSNDPNHHPGLK